jgi:NADH:ubiquinone oxidoreductase subunit 6 (subunit J)
VSAEIAILLSAALIVTVVVALFSKSVSVSLIMLFYSSLLLGIIFAIYGGVLVGLVHIITFAGAVSVMLLTVVLMTGESKLMTGSRELAVILVVITIPVVGAASYETLQGLPQGIAQPTIPDVTSLFQFVWQFRPWDLLILIMVFAASMLAVVNLLSFPETNKR